MLDFHTHTMLCGHAEGELEEYVKEAIKRKIKIYGVSDHAPLPDNLREGVSMRQDQAEDYIAIVQSLSGKYSDRIDIRIGFEVDFPIRDSFNSKYLNDDRIDYLIGSCHYLGDWPVDHSDFANEYEIRGVDNVYIEYYNSLYECAKSGLFNIIGHFDLPKKFGFRPSKNMNDRIVKIAKAASGTNTAVELNTSGLRKPVKEIYPSIDILKILFQENVAVTIGSDSHSPNDVGADYNAALENIKKVGYTKLVQFKKRKLLPYEI